MKNSWILLLFLCFTACSPLKKYAEQKAPWEEEVSKLLLLDQTESYPENAILFMGSSSIRLWENIKEDMRPYAAIRRGYGGAHFYDLIHFADRIAKPHKAAAIVLFVANDISGGDFDREPKEILRLFKFTVKELRKSHPNTPIFSIAITPTPSRWAVWDKTNTANELILDYCQKSAGLHFIDTRLVFLDQNGQPKPELFKSDMLHLKQVGYDLWKEIIKKHLDETL